MQIQDKNWNSASVLCYSFLRRSEDVQGFQKHKLKHVLSQFWRITSYIYFCSGFLYTDRPTIEIMQLNIDKDGLYTAVLKTFWIKIIQRKWKKRMVEKRQYMYNLKKKGRIVCWIKTKTRTQFWIAIIITSR
jgi:hypothetical protein